ncbi:SDR family oxidoreductase [bacterium]|nr:SDR family oxidoreductase [bacterium]
MILLFGATGKSGAPIADELARSGASFKVFVRKAGDAAAFEARGIAAARGDIHDPASLSAAMQGIEKVLYLSPGSPSLVEDFRPVLEAARAAGVKHFVRLSVIGAAPDSFYILGRWHGQADQLLKDSGLSWTILKLTFFMQNFLGMAGSIREQGAFYAPAGEGRAAFIDTRDIGAAAAAVLGVPEADGGVHKGREYTLTGPEALTHGDVARLLSEATGRQISFVDVPLEAMRQNLLGAGLPEAMAEALVDLMQNVQQTSRSAEIGPDLERLIGRPAQSFAAFAARHAADFSA